MRIAVTGGCGFIGSHVVDRLAGAGHGVLVLDNATTGDGLPAECRQVNVLDLPALQRALSKVDAVFHLAGMSNVDHAFADPEHTVQLNVVGTGNVLEAARRAGVGRVLLASTVWVYGAAQDPSGGRQPLSEEAPVAPSRAGHIYTSTKLAAEMLVHSYRETYGVPFTILRYGIPYGPRMRDELVLARFVRRAVDGLPLTVAGDGSQFRNYVYVADLAEAHLLALGSAAENEVIAVEGSERVSVLEMAEAVRRHFPGTRIEYVPARPGDFRGRELSNARAERLLGWRPTTSFREGVRRYVEWYLASQVPTGAVRPAGLT
jgi:UDP-glucose 4-epimerase